MNEPQPSDSRVTGDHPSGGGRGLLVESQKKRPPGGGSLSPAALTFFVPGVPRPQGSMQAIVSKSTGRAFMKQSPTVVEWRNVVVAKAWDAVEQSNWQVLDEGPVYLYTAFYFQRPKSHSRKRRESDGGIKHDGADLDKLVRAIGDALTVAGVIGDDRQIASIAARKLYAEKPGDEGAVVMVTRMSAGL